MSLLIRRAIRDANEGDSMITDPYPTELDDVAFLPPEAAAPDPLVNAITRLAQAIEQNTLALQRPQNPPNAALPPADPRLMSGYAPQPVQNAPGALAPLPPVQVVAQRPACPFHGIEKVAPSTNGKGGFYCQAKPGIGQPNTNPKGYCTWHT